MKTRRKTDKIEIIYKIAIAGMMGYVLYVVTPIKNELNKRIDKLDINVEKRIDKLEVKLDKEQDKLLNYYTECTKDINNVRKEYKEDITEKWEQILAWFRENGRGL